MVQSAGTVEYTDCISAEEYDSPDGCPGYDIKQSENSSPGALGNADYPCIAITPRSTLARSGSTLEGSIYGSNRTV